MVLTLDAALLVLAVICFALATVGVQARLNLLALGLLLWAATGLL